MHVQSEGDFYYLINNSKYSTTIVHFSANWSGTCRKIRPFFKELAVNNQSIQFLDVDVDDYIKLPKALTWILSQHLLSIKVVK